MERMGRGVLLVLFSLLRDVKGMEAWEEEETKCEVQVSREMGMGVKREQQ